MFIRPLFSTPYTDSFELFKPPAIVKTEGGGGGDAGAAASTEGEEEVVVPAVPMDQELLLGLVAFWEELFARGFAAEVCRYTHVIVR